MKECIYKKMLEDRIDNIRSTLDGLKFRLDCGDISYPEFLYIESNLYNDLLITQHELNDLERKSLRCRI